MYHQLNKVTGRLVTATNLQTPLFPIAPVALQRVEVPKIQHTATQMSTVAEGAACSPSSRRLIPGTNFAFAPVPVELVKKQQHFQKDNDEPVHLKGGPADKILYRLTMLLCVVGIIGFIDVVSGHAFPKKAQ